MGLTRRQFVIGAGSVVAAGAVGVGVIDAFDHSVFERGLHRAGLVSSPGKTFARSGATQQSGSLPSRYMHRDVGWTISHPSGSGPPDGVIVCLHGKGGDQQFAFDAVDLPDVAASVGLRVAVAGVDGGADSYWHKRADGTDALSMLLYEFVPKVRSIVGDVPRALMGWSMGGYGALLAAEREPTGFVAVAAASPALWLSPGQTAPGAFDSPSDFHSNDVFSSVSRLKGLSIAVACGTGDPFYSATRHLVAEMDFPHAVFFGPGFHDPSYWRSVAPRQLQAIASSFR